MLTYTLSAGAAKVYINGNLAGTGTQTTPQNVTRALCYIGKSQWAGDPYPNIMFDDLRIYNRVLSVTEMLSLTMEQPDAATIIAMPAATCPNTASAIKVIGSQIGVTYQLQNASTSANIGAAQPGNGDTLSFATGNLAATTTFQVVATGNGSCSVTLSSATVNIISLSSAPVTTGATRCEAGTVTLSASGAPNGAFYYWYTAPTGGLPVFIGPAFTTPVLYTTTTYYVAIYANGCESVRAAVTATINLATSPAVNLYTGLIAHYKFDGTTADSSGHGNNASLNYNGAYINDRFNQPGKAVEPVTNAYIDCFNAGDFQALTTQVTISIWINELPGNYNDYSPLVNKWQNNGLYMSLDNYYDAALQQQQNRVRWRINGSSAIVTSNTNVPYNSWQHIVCTYNGTTLKIYQNGQLTGSLNYTGVITNTITNMQIGRQANGFGNNIFMGAYDDTRIYNRELSAEEVQALYFNGSVAFANTPLCEGNTLQLNTVAITGATYAWNGPNGFSSSQQTPNAILNANAAVAGTYSLIITNPNGCTSPVQTNLVVVNPLPGNATTLNDTVCGSGNAMLTAAGAPAGATYRWYTTPTGGNAIIGQNTATYTITNLTATDTFYVSILSSTGCDSPGRTMVIAYYVNPVQTNLAVSGSTVCSNFSTTTVILQNSQQGVNYTAYYNSTAVSAAVAGNGGTITLTVNTAALPTGTNTITIQAAQPSCGNVNLTNTATVVKNAIPAATITASGPTTFCTGGAVTLSASSGAAWLWNNNSSTQNIVVNNSGSYSVTVTDANGCSNSSTTITVNEIAPPVATVSAAGPLTFCQGGNVTLNAGGGTGYVWSTGSTASSISVGSSGTYYVIASNGSCTDTSSTLAVNVMPTPTVAITASGPLAFCAGGNVTLISSAENSYLWSTTAASQSIVVTNSGTYQVTVTNTNGCSASSAPVTVTVSAVPNASITASGPTTICQGDNVVLNGNGGTSYTWSTGATSSSLSVTQAGTFYVIASNGSCTDTSATVTVTVNPLPVVNFSMGADTFFCTYTPVYTLTGGNPAGGTYSGPGVSGGQFNAANAGTGNVQLNYTYADANGCSVTISDNVFVDVCTGAIDLSGATIFSVIPNPASALVTIRWPANANISLLEVFDMSGRLVITENVSGKTAVQVSLEELRSGMYQVKLSGDAVHFMKLIKE